MVEEKGFVHMKSKYQLLSYFKELGFKVGAEIGVSQGHFSEAMLQEIPGLKLYCVDVWKAYRGNRWMPPTGRADVYYEIAKKRLAPYNAILIRKFSMDALADIPDGSLDFVYIDANHAFDYVMEDLINWSRKVKVGGIISGDDYYHFKKAGVVEAVDAYTKAHGIIFQLTDPLSEKIQDRGCQEQPSFWWIKHE